HRLAIDGEGALLHRRRLADHQGAADLREIALDRGRQLGRHQIAFGDAALRRRRHGHNILSTRAHDHEIVGAAAAAEERLDLRDELELRSSRHCGLAKDLIASSASFAAWRSTSSSPGSFTMRNLSTRLVPSSSL